LEIINLKILEMMMIIIIIIIIIIFENMLIRQPEATDKEGFLM